MFLHLLNEDQQKAFLALAKQFVETDAALSAEEQNLVELMYAEADVPFETELPQGNLGELLQPFDTRQARAAVLLELIGAAHADQKFEAEENAFIGRVAKAFGVDDAELGRMQDWVERQVALAREVQQFWAE